MVSVLLSGGGIDSLSVLDHVSKSSGEIVILHYDYGQKACQRERAAITRAAELFKARVEFQCVSCFDESNKAVYDTSAIAYDPDRISLGGERTPKKSVNALVIPFRNVVFLSCAAHYAVSIGAECIYTGFDQYAKNPCKDELPDFVDKFMDMMKSVNQGWKTPKIKTQSFPRSVVRDFESPFTWQCMVNHLPVETCAWSCLNDTKKHCGVCVKCTKRMLHISATGSLDRTSYHTIAEISDILQEDVKILQDEFLWKERGLV